MLAPILICLGCHVFLFVCVWIAWYLLESDNATASSNNHHLIDYRPRIDAQGHPHVRLPFLERLIPKGLGDRAEERWVRSGESVVHAVKSH